MKRSTLIVTIVAAAALVSGAAVGAHALMTGTTGLGPTVGDCKTYQIADTGGRISFGVPWFCREDMCEIRVGWWGEPVGAFSQGLTWPISFIQWNDTAWQAGPAACIAGVCLTQGTGRNGNGVSEDVLGPYTAELGSYFRLTDDLAPENNPLRLTFELVQADPALPEFESVILFLCPG